MAIHLCFLIPAIVLLLQNIFGIVFGNRHHISNWLHFFKLSAVCPHQCQPATKHYFYTSCPHREPRNENTCHVTYLIHLTITAPIKTRKTRWASWSDQPPISRITRFTHTHTRAIMPTKHFKYHQDHTIECVTAWPFYLPRNKRQVGAELRPNFVPAKWGWPNVVHPNIISCSPVTLSCPIIQLYIPNKHACGIFMHTWHVYSMINKPFLIHYHDWKQWCIK